MKRLILLLLVTLPVYLRAQTYKPAEKSSPPDTIVKALYVVDGKVLNDEQVKAIDDNALETVTVLKGNAAISLYGKAAANGVVVITTKKMARSVYQKKLSLLSDEYKNFIIGHKRDDSHLMYVINGRVLPKDKNEISILSAVSKSNISNISLIKNQSGGDKILAKVLVTIEN